GPWRRRRARVQQRWSYELPFARTWPFLAHILPCCSLYGYFCQAPLGVQHLTMQTEKPPFDDLRVRQAISEALRREAFIELGTQSGVVGTGNYPFGPWGMPKEMRNELIGYGPDMAKRIAHAKQLLASYEKEKGKIDWSKLKAQCASNVKFSC